jgi:hypothetical protein
VLFVEQLCLDLRGLGPERGDVVSHVAARAAGNVARFLQTDVKTTALSGGIGGGILFKDAEICPQLCPHDPWSSLDLDSRQWTEITDKRLL